MPRKPPPVRSVVAIPHVSASAFKATCLELMDKVARTRSELIVTKHGRPVVRISPVEPQGTSPVGFLAGSILRHGDIVSADDTMWERSTTDPLARKRRG